MSSVEGSDCSPSSPRGDLDGGGSLEGGAAGHGSPVVECHSLEELTDALTRWVQELARDRRRAQAHAEIEAVLSGREFS